MKIVSVIIAASTLINNITLAQEDDCFDMFDQVVAGEDIYDDNRIHLIFDAVEAQKHLDANQGHECKKEGKFCEIMGNDCCEGLICK